MTNRLIDLTGEVFWPLTVIRRAPNENPNNRNSRWVVRCDCGHELCRKVIIVTSAHLRSGHTQSCGSKRTQKFAFKHGHASSGLAGLPTPIYRAWISMRNRCNNPKANNYKDWGGRGITVCERWNSFENFLADTGPTWFPGAENDRIDPMGNYCPENQQWVEKGTGRRRTSVLVSWKGKTMLATAACKDAGVSRAAVFYWMRYHKSRSFEEAVTQLKKNEQGDGLRFNSIRVSLDGEILNLQKAAKILGLSYPNLYRLMHRRGFSFEKAVDHLRSRRNDKQKYAI